ncbi:hypothetical protein MMC07_009936 [Pseudocyphellaria aurata]|nr:hypothetical protein [Pseudocyphellaria aurata]
MVEVIAAVGLASAIVSLVEFGAKVIKRLDEFKTNVHDLPQSFLHISRQLPLLVKVANSLHEQACDNRLDQTTKDALLPVVAGLEKEIRKLDTVLLEVLPAAQASTWEKCVMAVKSLTVQKKKVDDIAAVIQAYVVNLTAFQTTYNAAVNRSLVRLITNQTSRAPASEPQKPRKPAWMVNFDSDRHFVGRDEIIEAIEGQFRDEKSRVVLTGIGGVGKSRIAIQYCYRYRQQFADNDVFWVHGASKARFETAYQQIAGRLELPGRQDREVDHLQLVSDWLSDEEHGSWLMVLDNADDRDLWLPPSARKPLITYLPRGHHGRILITSRDNQLGYSLVEGKHDPIKVTRLGPIEARHLLQSKLFDGNELGDKDADKLTALLEYLPLTITQAAAYLKEIREPVTQYLDLLKNRTSDIPDILEESVDDPGRDREDREASNSVFLTWRISFDHISRQSERAADTLSLMAMLDRQAISLELLQRPEDKERPLELKAAISKLKAFAFIAEENVPSTYSLHRLVQISTQRWLDHHNRLLTWQEAAVSAVAEKISVHRRVQELAVVE